MRTGDFSKLVNAAGRAESPSTIPTHRDLRRCRQRASRPARSSPATSFRLTVSILSRSRSRKYMPALRTGRRPRGSRYAHKQPVPSRIYFDKDKFYNLILKFDIGISGARTVPTSGTRRMTALKTAPDNGIDNKPGTSGQ